MEYKDPGRYIPIIYLLYSWGSRFGVPSRVPLSKASQRLLFCGAPWGLYSLIGMGVILG